MADLGGGFAKKRHRIAVAWRVWDGGRHSHGGRGGYGGVAKNGGICLVFVCGRSWADPTQPYPVMHSIKCCPTPHLTSASFPHLCVLPSPRRTQPPPRQATPAQSAHPTAAARDTLTRRRRPTSREPRQRSLPRPRRLFFLSREEDEEDEDADAGQPTLIFFFLF